jgi:hypothetical protein
LLLTPVLIVAGLLAAYLLIEGQSYWIQLTVFTVFPFGMTIEAFRGERKHPSFWLLLFTLFGAHLFCCYYFRIPRDDWRPKESAFLAAAEGCLLILALSWWSARSPR